MSLPLSGWATFYEVTGSAAGALTGLQFVVITLIAQRGNPGSMREISAFGTPTVVHFCVALLISATMSGPWDVLSNLAYCLGAYGVGGIAYSLRVLWHARLAEYNPDTEDWLWYSVFPLLAYAALLAAAMLLQWHTRSSVVIIAGTDLLFLFVGIHNSWDTVTYLTLQADRNHEQQKQTATSENT